MPQNRYIKSPLNYTGGKYRLLDRILPAFPRDSMWASMWMPR